MVQGTYALSDGAGVANTTRGILAATALDGGTSTDADGKQLDLATLDALFLAMYTAGAPFSNLVLYVGGALKQRITKIYGYAPEDRNIGGLNIKQVETDFGNIGIVLSRFAPANTVLAIEMSVVAPVFQETPGKGILFAEPLAKTGAADAVMLFGQIGFDHGPAFMHGSITNVIA